MRQVNKEKSGCLLSFHRVTDTVKYKRNYNLSVFKLENIYLFLYIISSQKSLLLQFKKGLRLS